MPLYIRNQQGLLAKEGCSWNMLRHAQSELSEVALGGTAVGTGVNTHPEFASRVCLLLSEMNGVVVRETSNHFQAQSTLDSVVETSGALNTLAVSLMKIADDIRWLGSGPRAGIGELDLPAVQPGSSIMPGEAYRTGKTIREVAREKTTFSEEELDRILDPAKMTKPGLEGGPAGG
jgi:fumarate hydratase class II